MAATAGSRRSAERPADERQAQPAVVDGERAGGEERVDELAAAVREAAEVAAGLAVAQRQLELRDAEPGARGVDRHAHFAAESGGEREALLRARPRDSARWPESGSRASKPASATDERARHALGDPEAAAAALGERGDREVGAVPDERPEVARRGRRRRARAAPAAQPARRASAPVPCLAAAAAARGRRRAPPRRAVASREPSSATITSRCGELLPERLYRLRRSCPPRRVRRREPQPGQPLGWASIGGTIAVVGAGLQAVVPSRAAGQEQREREAARGRVDVVDGRHPVLAPGRNGRAADLRRSRPRPPGPPRRPGPRRRRRESVAVGPLCGLTVRATTTPSAGLRKLPAFSSTSWEVRASQAGVSPPFDELVCKLAAEVVEAPGLVLGQVAVEVPVEVRRVDRNLERAQAHRCGAAGVRDRLLDLLHHAPHRPARRRGPRRAFRAAGSRSASDTRS